MTYTRLAYNSIFAILILTSCGSGKLTRGHALNLLQEAAPSGTSKITIRLCPQEMRQYKIRATSYTFGAAHPCRKYSLKYNDNFEYEDMLTEHFKVLSRTKLNFRYGDGYSGKEDVYDLIEPIDADFAPFVTRDTDDPNIVHLRNYDYKIGRVVGIRELQGGDASDCDAKVDYAYERTNKAPWADMYVEEIHKYPETHDACFVKYDDGWRVVKKRR